MQTKEWKGLIRRIPHPVWGAAAAGTLWVVEPPDDTELSRQVKQPTSPTSHAGLLVKAPWLESAVRTSAWLNQLQTISVSAIDLLRTVDKTNFLSTEVLRTINAGNTRTAEVLKSLDEASTRTAQVYLAAAEHVASAAAAADRVLNSPAFKIATTRVAELLRLSDAISSSIGQLGPTLLRLPALDDSFAGAAYGWRGFVETAASGTAVTPAVCRDLFVGGRGTLGVNVAVGTTAGVQLDVDRDLLDGRRQPHDVRRRLLRSLGTRSVPDRHRLAPQGKIAWRAAARSAAVQSAPGS